MAADKTPVEKEQGTQVEEELKVRTPLRRKPSKRGQRRKGKGKATGDPKAASKFGNVAFPKHSLLKCLRIPQAILDQNAGNECTGREAAAFAKIGWAGAIGVEIGSAIKYGLLERPAAGKVKPTERVRQVVRPQAPDDRISALRDAVLSAPVISDFYKRYRGEHLPDLEFLQNTAVDSFDVPKERVAEFLEIFLETLKDAELLEEVAGGKTRVLDVRPRPRMPVGTPLRGNSRDSRRL
ncbi:MAG: hypothetical protein NTY38_23840 [Acidobacteria bacterium]|nr:hypothetical protein [Acidobacteriota bacterium]